ncbi:MAG: hypothetical protein WAK48_01200 [Candidatus Acidiferrum sp.]|jgi:hypothetical protein
MRFARKLGAWLLLIGGVAVLASAVRAQDPQEPQDTDAETQTKPKPAAHGIPAIDDTTDDNSPAPNWQPDTNPVTGLEAPTLGAPELGHSYWIPGFIYGSTIQSQPPGLHTNNGWYANNYIGGEVSLLETWSRSQLALNYSGGGVITTDSSPNTGQNGWFQQLSVGQHFNLHHWQIQWLDYFSYLPESQFSFGVGTGLALPGVNGMTGTLGPSIPGLSLSLAPIQSIYSAFGPRYSNAFATQVTYLLSPRASITFGGAYELLDFTEAGNVSSNSVLGSAGFNYALNPHDSIGILYRFEGFHFDGEPQALGTQTISVAYQKKVTKKLALALYAGPQLTSNRIPVNKQTSSLGVSAGAFFTYAFERSTFSLSYFHGVSAGSGVLVGANSDTLTSAFTRTLGRVWTGNLLFGYSRNSALDGVTATAAVSTYDDFFAGGSISRPFGRNVQISAAYTANFQNTNGPTCTGTGCNSSSTQNVITITLQFQTRPFVLP